MFMVYKTRHAVTINASDEVRGGCCASNHAAAGSRDADELLAVTVPILYAVSCWTWSRQRSVLGIGDLTVGGVSILCCSFVALSNNVILNDILRIGGTTC